MKANSRMQDLLNATRAMSMSQLPDDAKDVLEAGWVVEPGGSILLRRLWSGRRQPVDPSDIGGYEYHTNDVYIALSDLADDMSSYLARAVGRGMFFAVEMLRKASKFSQSDGLLSVVSVSTDTESDDFLIQGATVRFFSQRGDYPRWFEDLERFELEAVAVIGMEDVKEDHTANH